MDISPNMVDGVVIGAIFVSAVLAWSRGFTRESLGLLGWALAAVGAAASAPFLMPYMTKLPVIGGVLSGNCQFTLGAAFFIAFAVILAILAILTPSLGDAVRNSSIGALDKALGFLFGAARGVLLIAVAAWALDLLMPNLTDSPAMTEARTGAFLGDLRQGVRDLVPTQTPAWASGRIDNLMAACGSPAPAPAAADPTQL